MLLASAIIGCTLAYLFVGAAVVGALMRLDVEVFELDDTQEACFVLLTWPFWLVFGVAVGALSLFAGFACWLASRRKGKR